MAVSVVVPAYNEDKYISGVLEPLQEVEQIKEIIVVSDGSTDNTAAEAKKWQATVIELEKNSGKGAAMHAGFLHAREDNILFLDADLLGLTREHILNLIIPVESDEADMTLGIFEHGRFSTDLAQIFAPYLTGQRCIKKRLLNQFDEWENAGFGVETALNNYAQQKQLRIKHINLPAMSHVMKEEKLGLVRGFAYRMKMYYEIAKKVRTGV